MYKNKIIVISGSSGLIGDKIKKYFISQGAKVIGLDVNKIDDNTIKCDITNEKSVKKSFRLILKKYKSIDLLINNASRNPIVEKVENYKFSNYDLKKWKSGLDDKKRISGTIGDIGSWSLESSKHINVEASG